MRKPSEMTQTEHLMAAIVTHGHDIEALKGLCARHAVRMELTLHAKCMGALATLIAERDIKRDQLARVTDRWFR